MNDIILNFNYVQFLSSEYMIYNENELRSYLGIRSIEQFIDLKDKISFLSDEVVRESRPKVCWRYVKVNISQKGHFFLGDLEIKSSDLSKNLLNCDFAIIFCATLGVGVDRFIKKSFTKSSADGVIVNSISSAYIEGVCDLFYKKNLEKFCGLSSRFSCGYGDFSISYQRDILNLLEAEKNIGLFCTDSYLLIPSKSVTAIIGIKKGFVDEDFRTS